MSQAPRRKPPLLLWRVLHLAIPEGPVLWRDIDEIDEDVLLAHAGLGVEIVGDLAIKCLLHLGAAPGVPRHLDEDNAVGVIDAKIAFLGKHQLGGGVAGDVWELALGGALRDCDYWVMSDAHK